VVVFAHVVARAAVLLEGAAVDVVEQLTVFVVFAQVREQAAWFFA